MKQGSIIFSILLFSFLALNKVEAQSCEALFTWDGTDITMQFIDQSTSAPNDPIVSWFWDFEDGTTSSQQNPLHTFPEPGVYDVILIITTSNGCTSEIEIRIETCAFNITVDVDDCDPNDQIPITITVQDIYDNAKEIDISVDGQILPGGPFDIDIENPVVVNTTVPGDGLPHTISIQSLDIETCAGNAEFTAPDCGSNCFLSSMSVNFSSGITHTVNVGGNFFSPANTTLVISDIVEFVWVDGGHTSTSDATSGPDSWNSGELGFGATYSVTLTNPGVHPFYCIPHGGPGGAGMSGQLIANCPTGNQFDLLINFNTTVADPAGYNVLLDGVVQPGSPHQYNGTGPQSVTASLSGDGLTHTFEIQDIADPSCIVSRVFDAPDCGAAPSCSLSLSAIETGGCDGANNVALDVTINSVNGGASGFNLLVDGSNVGSFSYDPSGTTVVTIDVNGDGQAHNIEAQDIDDPTCSATTSIITTDCSIPCSISNLAASTGNAATHVVFVEDFAFNPQNITITSGDIIEWQWTGTVDHTTTSDATTGPDSWDSGLLGTGAVYQSPVLTAGLHPYYCIPHGGPGGQGMSGSVTVQANCTNGQVSVSVSFDETGGSINGFEVLVDGISAGTFAYDPTGSNTVSILVDGDGQSHTIQVVDLDDPACSASTSVTTPDCNATSCQLSISATEVSGCNNNNVGVEVSITDIGGGASGFDLLLDGASVGTYAYDASGTTVVTIDVIGDGQAHNIEVQDIDDPTCSATTSIITTDCSIPCSISNLAASTGNAATHVVFVEDFAFNPQNITITSGDIIEWQWTGTVDHTTTSDATTGPDSWDSGLLGTGAVYQSPVLTAGLHPYYCIPHGGPGGQGMSGSVTVQADCTNGQVSVSVSFDESGGSINGFEVLVDGISAGTFAYDPTGSNTVSILVDGDGQSHTIQVVDVDDPACSASTSVTTPDCNATSCQLSISATEVSGCNNNNVGVEVSITDIGGGASGFDLLLDGASVGTYAYDASGTTVVTIDVNGDGQAHNIEVQDIDDPTCSATTSIITTDCSIPCSISNLTASTGNATTHVVFVEDFAFNPQNITITSGDIIEWQWTGTVDHTTTSDATTGPDSWDSGLLGTGAVYQSPVLTAGLHPYYCIPHGGPGGQGMSGSVTVQADCTNGQVSVSVSFDESGGSINGFEVLVDGISAGTFTYDPTGSNTVSILVDGDGQSHTIQVVDLDDPACSASTSVTTPDCNATSCQLSISATEVSGCNNNNVGVEVSITDIGGGASGFDLLLDGASVGTYAYDASGTTVVTIDVIGDGQSHNIEVQDIDDPTCSATTSIITTDCSIPCSISNLAASTGNAATHVVFVEDFAFNPQNITITSGDIIEWQWTGTVDHTTTSDATTGPDSWDSGLLGTGAVYQSPVLTAGLHPYYCIPHGGPGGQGMSGSVTVQADCTNGQVSVSVSFDESGGSINGFEVLVDGISAGTFAYDPTGSNTVSILVDGDGQSHTIQVVDLDDPACSASTSVTTPDCNATSCQLSISATEVSGCNNNNVGVEVSITDIGGGASGFDLLLDGASVGTYAYDASGTTVVTIDVIGDGQAHNIEVQDIDDPTCSATTSIITTDCSIPCSISNLTASTGNAATHVVFVEDFAFNPQNITITSGDIIEWQWTGTVDHTTTSDATTGPDSWDSGLLGTGAVYQSPVLTAGLHPYYCIPHGGPGGQGMSGSVTVQADCTNGQVSVSVSFDESGGSINGFEVLVDGISAGTFTYDPTGSNTVSILVDGDGQSHTIQVADLDDPACSASVSVTTPDCNATTCQLSVSATEVSGCNNNNVGVEVSITDIGGGASGFDLLVDGASIGTYAYDASGTTVVNINVAGDGQLHTIEVQDIDDPTCSASTSLNTTDCVIPCSLTDLTVNISGSGNPVTHNVEVKDFEFLPVDLTVSTGDIVHFEWTGVIEHTSTSDATTGQDVWDSGYLGQGAVFDVTINSEGEHPYYCIPHGGPGGQGMSGSITSVPPSPCNNGEVNLQITFNEINGSPNGFQILYDGTSIGSFTYHPSGITTVNITVSGDGQIHTLEIQDLETAACSISGTVEVPDCNIPAPCSLSVTSQQVSDCDTNNEIGVELNILSENNGSAYNITVDGNLYPGGPFTYDVSNTTVQTINIGGTGQSRTIEVQDIDSTSCIAQTIIETPLCGPPCEVLNLSVSIGQPVKHIIEVKDFEFVPANIDVLVGDTVEFVWTGVIEHTTTSDATSGPNSWDSGLLGQGAVYQVIIDEAGSHPYYCIPHGGPGGIGMAGTINALEACDNGQAQVAVNFEVTNGSSLGYNIFLDGNFLSGPHLYSNQAGANSTVISLNGDAQQHILTVQDLDVNFCAASITFTAPECEVLCEVLNLTATTGSEVIHIVYVEDFEFSPATLNIYEGETVRFIWTGNIPHSATSDATMGPDAFDSGIIGLGSEYEVVFQNSGTHPYYCIPHGGPGGIGMAGVINVLPNCEDNLVSVNINFNITSGSTLGYNVFVDGSLYSGSPFPYDTLMGMNSQNILIPGDGGTHLITVQDLDVNFCAATTTVSVIDCNAICEITNPQINFQTAQKHIIEVKDFEFTPLVLDVLVGDTIEFVWTGVIEHTTTSDATSGANVWDSGLLGQGATYQVIITEEGAHPYYCIPHGGPGGIGMAGTINAVSPCNDGNATAQLSFNNSGAGSEYNIYIDGSLYAGSPYNYGAGGVTSLEMTLPGDGGQHEILIEDQDDPNCTANLVFESPLCDDACILGFSINQSDCDDNNEVLLNLTVFSQNEGTNGFNIFIDGNLKTGSPFTYSANDTTNVSLMIAGDGLAHDILIADVDQTSCNISQTFTALECSMDCFIQVTAEQIGNCNGNQQVSYHILVQDENSGINGFELLINGIAHPNSPFPYQAGGTTNLGISLPGDGGTYEIIVNDVDNQNCLSSTSLTTPNCSEDCVLDIQTINIGVPKTHIVEVLDFEFSPLELTVEVGDIVRFEWVGAIPHTVTSDATIGNDVWNSGLLGQGEVFEVTINTAGTHPYYCIPHGAPGGVGMAAVIFANEACDDDILGVEVTFISNNAGLNGYSVLLDGSTIPNSPFSYDLSGNHNFVVDIAADGQAHQLIISDVDNPGCTVDTTFIMPDCDDPCFGFEAQYDFEFNLQTLELNFTDLSTGNPDSWLWDFGDGTTSSEQYPQHFYAEEGVYEVCLIIGNSLIPCSDTICQTIDLEQYICEAEYSFSIDNLTVNFFDQSTTNAPIDNWIWDLGNGLQIVGQQNPVFTYDSLGVYNVCLSIEADSCVSDTCMLIDLSDPCLSFQPGFSFTQNANNLGVQFVDMSTGNPNQWLWGFGDGNTSNSQHPYHEYDTPGTYNVCLLVQDTLNDCNESYCKSILINTTSITNNKYEKQLLVIYPNPSRLERPIWTIEGILEKDFGKDLDLKIYDYQGKTIIENKYKGTEQLQVNCPRTISAGIYIIEIRSEQRIYSGRIIAQ